MDSYSVAGKFACKDALRQSVLRTLLATIIFDRLWLREAEPRAQRMFRTLWVLFPCLRLYSRMVRSYSMALAQIFFVIMVLDNERWRIRFVLDQ